MRGFHCSSGTSRKNVSGVFSAFVNLCRGPSVYAITICLVRCTRLVEKLLTMTWNDWLSRKSTILRAAIVSCLFVGDWCSTNVSKLEAVIVTIMAGVVLVDIITFRARCAVCALITFVVNGRLLQQMHVCRRMGAPLLNAPFCCVEGMTTGC